MLMTEEEIKIHRLNSLEEIAKKKLKKKSRKKRRRPASTLYYKRSRKTKTTSSESDSTLTSASREILQPVNSVTATTITTKKPTNSNNPRLIRLSTKFNAGGLQEIAKDDASDSSSSSDNQQDRLNDHSRLIQISSSQSSSEVDNEYAVKQNEKGELLFILFVLSIILLHFHLTCLLS